MLYIECKCTTCKTEWRWLRGTALLCPACRRPPVSEAPRGPEPTYIVIRKRTSRLLKEVRG